MVKLMLITPAGSNFGNSLFSSNCVSRFYI